MVCQACGAAIAEGVHFCSRCGAQVVGVPPAYQAYQQPPMPLYVPVPRVPRHLQTLGVLWCVFGVYRIASGLFGNVLRSHSNLWAGSAAIGRLVSLAARLAPQWMNAMIPFIATMIVISAGLALLVGYSLLTRRPWGRTLAIIVAILSLLKIPFGTALGIYTLWVLAPADSGAEYDSIADRT